MQVITFLNEKGGVGKTTLARESALALAQMGYRVVMIDADGQGDLTRSVSLPKAPHFNDFCRRADTPLKSLVQRVPKDVTPYQLYIITGNEESWGIAGSSSRRVLVQTMANRMRDMSKVFDFCIIDTKPSPDMLHDAISVITNWLIFPTDPEFFSSGPNGGLEHSFNNMAFNREQGLKNGKDIARPLAIVPNKYRSRTIYHQQIVDYLKTTYGDLVWEPIPLRTAVTESQLAKESLTHRADHLDTSKAIWDFARRIEQTIKEATSE